MSYTCLDKFGKPKPLRLLGVDEETGKHIFKKQFSPANWEIDTCARPEERMKVVQENGITMFFRWYEYVIVGEDTDHDMAVKIEHAERVDQAIDEVNEAKQKLKILLG